MRNEVRRASSKFPIDHRAGHILRVTGVETIYNWTQEKRNKESAYSGD